MNCYFLQIEPASAGGLAGELKAETPNQEMKSRLAMLDVQSEFSVSNGFCMKNNKI